MSTTAMGIDHLKATGQPDPNTPGADMAVPVGPLVPRFAQAPLGFIHLEPASQNPLQWDISGGLPGVPVPGTGGGDQE